MKNEMDASRDSGQDVGELSGNPKADALIRKTEALVILDHAKKHAIDDFINDIGSLHASPGRTYAALDKDWRDTVCLFNACGQAVMGEGQKAARGAEATFEELKVAWNGIIILLVLVAIVAGIHEYWRQTLLFLLVPWAFRWEIGFAILLMLLLGIYKRLGQLNRRK
jgi:hypothetical protein